MFLFLSRRFASKTPAQMLNNRLLLEHFARIQSSQLQPEPAQRTGKSIRRVAGGGELDQSRTSQ